jgi:hypothetical protein
LIVAGGEVRDNNVINFVPNSVSGECFNHQSPTKADWHNALWREKQYPKLLELKKNMTPK